MKKKIVCTMLIASLCFSQLVAVSAETISDNSAQITAQENDTIDEAQKVTETEKQQEVIAETESPNIQNVAAEIRICKAKEYVVEFMGAKGQQVVVALYKADDTEFKNAVVLKTGSFSSERCQVNLAIDNVDAGDYVLSYNYFGMDDVKRIPFYVRKSIDVAENTQISKTQVANAVYTGGEILPVITIVETVDGKPYTLVKDKDYTVKVVSENKKEYGQAKVEITGMGDFTGTITKEFDIVPSMPVVTKAVCTGYKSAKITWEKIPGVDGYDIERKTGEGKFEIIGSVKGENTITYTDEKNEKFPLITGQTYSYRVRATKRVGADRSREVSSNASETGLSVTILPSSPKLIELKSTSYNKLKLSWEKVEGATGYAVYQVLSNGKVKRIKYVTSTSYTITKDVTTKKNLVCGKTYRYTVKAYLKNPETGEKIFSSLNSVGIKAKAKPATPTLISAKANGGKKVTIKWKEVANAYGYYIYRKEANNEDAQWKRIKTVKLGDTTSYVDTKATIGTTYVYSVKAYTKVNGKKISGDMDQKGKKVTPLPGKTAIKLTITSNGTAVEVKIANVLGADGYYIYRKQNSGKYSSYARVDAKVGDYTTYTDTSIAYGSSFEYYVIPFVKGESKRIKGTKSDKVKIVIK